MTALEKLVELREELEEELAATRRAMRVAEHDVMAREEGARDELHFLTLERDELIRRLGALRLEIAMEKDVNR